jgi:hypothetical protein
MKAATASAPGKLILLGEHAVVYGKTAVATCLSALRVAVTAVRGVLFLRAGHPSFRCPKLHRAPPGAPRGGGL